jgi:formate/nitrite transporter
VLPLSVLAGAFIGYGASLALALGGCLSGAVHPATQRLVFGAVGFQVGLLAIAITGAELFTGNSFFFAAALLEGRAKLKDILPRAAACWIGNLAGVAAMAALLVLGSSGAGPGVSGAAALFALPPPPPPSAAPAAAMAAAKASLPALAAFARAVLCNVCVCVAVVQAASARSMFGKAIGIWLPLSCFASLGLEHSVANMFVFALAAFSGAGAPVAGVVGNLVVVSVGNVVGAAVVLAGLLKLGHGS